MRQTIPTRNISSSVQFLRLDIGQHLQCDTKRLMLLLNQSRIHDALWEWSDVSVYLFAPCSIQIALLPHKKIKKSNNQKDTRMVSHKSCIIWSYDSLHLANKLQGSFDKQHDIWIENCGLTEHIRVHHPILSPYLKWQVSAIRTYQQHQLVTINRFKWWFYSDNTIMQIKHRCKSIIWRLLKTWISLLLLLRLWVLLVAHLWSIYNNNPIYILDIDV